MYFIFLIILMIIFTLCISLIIIKGKKSISSDKLTDDVDFINKDYTKDDEII